MFHTTRMDVITFISLMTSLLLAFSSNPSSTSSPHQNVNNDESLSDLGIIEYDAQGNPVHSPTRIQFNTNDYPSLDVKKVEKVDPTSHRVALSRYPLDLRNKFIERTGRVPNFQVPPYLYMAAAYHGISHTRLTTFLFRNQNRNNLTHANDISKDELVAGKIHMDQLRKTASELEKYFKTKSRETRSSTSEYQGKN